MRVALFVVIAVASCADRQPSPRTTTGSSAAVGSAGSGAGSGDTMNASVTVTVVGTKPGRPPVDRVLVDVQLRNDDKAARWFLIPTKVPIDDGGGVDKLEQLTVPAGSATVAVGRFLGRAGTYAVELAPGARVTLRKLELAWWREHDEKDITFDVSIAAGVKIGDAAMATWFDKDPAISGAADVDMDAAKHTRSQKSSTGDEISLTLDGATKAPVKLAVP